MPIYEYRCTNDHRFEVMQRIVEDPLTECEVCGAPATRVLHPVAIHFKGSGFYSTDYGRGGRRKGEGSKDGEGGSGDKSDKSEKSEKKESSSTEKKAAEAS
jgi:putative FmdB family regulatory protein